MSLIARGSHFRLEHVGSKLVMPRKVRASVARNCCQLYMHHNAARISLPQLVQLFTQHCKVDGGGGGGGGGGGNCGNIVCCCKQ